MTPDTKNARPYDKSGFYWAVMYKPRGISKPHICSIHPNWDDARRQVLGANRRWKEQGMGDWHWSVKRFMFRFRGSEIDAFEHEWRRREKRK